jgi:hypothetical protein
MRHPFPCQNRYIVIEDEYNDISVFCQDRFSLRVCGTLLRRAEPAADAASLFNPGVSSAPARRSGWHGGCVCRTRPPSGVPPRLPPPRPPSQIEGPNHAAHPRAPPTPAPASASGSGGGRGVGGRAAGCAKRTTDPQTPPRVGAGAKMRRWAAFSQRPQPNVHPTRVGSGEQGVRGSGRYQAVMAERHIGMILWKLLSVPHQRQIQIESHTLIRAVRGAGSPLPRWPTAYAT